MAIHVRKIYALIAMLPLVLLGGCGSKRPAYDYNFHGTDKITGEPIVNAFTIGADWCMYFGILCMFAAVVLIFFKMIKTGGQCFIAGVSCFVFAQILTTIGSHLYIFIALFVAITITAGFCYHKAITSGLPWLEKLCKQDFNDDGHIGTIALRKPVTNETNETSAITEARDRDPEPHDLPNLTAIDGID